MSESIKVQGHTHLVRDLKSQAIINTDSDAYARYMARKAKQKVKDDESPIIGKELTDDQLFHMGCSVAIQDAIALIQQMEAYGYFAEGDEEGEDLSKPGPAG